MLLLHSFVGSESKKQTRDVPSGEPESPMTRILTSELVHSFMNYRHLILCGLLLFSTGCGDVQRGLYVVSSHGSVALSPECSQLVLVSGSRNTQEEMGNEELLLAVIAFSPGFRSSSSTNECESGTHVTSIRRENHGANGSFDYNVAWNRTDETVVFGSREFRRTEGNVFFLLDDDSPEHLIWQIPGVFEEQSVDAILEYARRWSVDSDVASPLAKLEEHEEGGRIEP